MNEPKTVFWGRVHFFHRDKGWGFIIPDGSDIPDVFVHFSAIQSGGKRKNLDRGKRVIFSVEKRNGRNCAADVWAVDEEGKVSGDSQDAQEIVQTIHR